jgi:glycosyltransferase involved in cell wall biosynthesis
MLALVGDMTGPTLWRCLQPITALERRGYPCGWEHKDTQGIGQLAPLFDGFLVPRISWPPGQRGLAESWFRGLHAAGRFVVYDSDDDIFTSLVSHRAVALGMNECKTLAELEGERYERVWAMQQADGVTVSTPRLATVVRSFTDRPVVVVPNAIDVPWFRRVLRATRRQISGLTIGWAGGKRPDDDLRRMAEAWGRIAARFPAVRFVVQGHVPAVATASVPAERLVRLPWMPLERYPAGLAEVDIACAAVVDDRFNRCKSAIKAYEAAVAGAAVVATPTVYGSVIEHGRTGYLAETADEWEAALAELVARPALRAMMARRLLRQVERQHSLERELWRWPAAWQTIAEDARARRGRLVAR